MKKQLNYKSLNTLGDVDITQSIVPGGGTAESTIEYLDLSGVDESKILGFVSFGILAKIPNAGIFPPTLFALEDQVSDLRSTTAIAVDYGIEFIMGGMNMNVESLANNMGLDITSVPRLTKEQFYKLPVALTIYTYYKDAIAHQDEMKFAFDTLWAIWERDGVEGQELAITIPNADIASITYNTEGTTFNGTPDTMIGGVSTSKFEVVTYIQFDRQWYGPQIRKVENLNTGEITYLYHSES